MSETKTTEQKVHVTCNGISWPMSVATFGKASPNKGKTFLTPVFSHVTAGAKTEDEKLKKAYQALAFVGIDNLLSFADTFARRAFASLAVDETLIDKDTGLLDMEAWLEQATKWTEGQEGLADLRAVILSKRDEILAIVDSQAKYYDNGDTENPEFIELGKKALAIGDELKPLVVKDKEITAKYEARAALRKQNKERKEAELLAKEEANKARMTEAEATRAEIS